MNEQTKRVPKIRFPGFADDWEQRKLGEVFEYLQNNTLSRAELNLEGGVAKNVHYGDVLIKYSEYLDASEESLPFISSQQVADKFQHSLLQDGDVIMADTAEDETVGKCIEIAGLQDFPTISGLHTIPLRPKRKFATGYLGFFMNSSYYHEQLKPLMQGIKVTSVSKSGIHDTVISYPIDLAEQKCIAQVFINLDKVITLHQRKHDSIKQFKQGMLQKMFPKEGEKVPEIRFPGFTGVWEQRKFSEIADCIDGNYGEKYPKDNEFIDEGVPFFTSAVTGADGVFNKENVKYISEEKNAILLKAQSKGGDLILTNRGASMGIIAEIPQEYGLVNIGPQLTRIRGKEGVAFNRFLLSNLQTSKNNKKLTSMNAGSAMPFIGLSGLGSFELQLPSFEEQKKIGLYFESLDNLITLHQRKLDQMKLYKQGLLQQMFV